MLKLYDYTEAPSPRRARMILAEKGIKHENIQIDLKKAEQLGDAFRKINPRCTVPVLVTDDGDVFTDNASITAYLEAAYPQNPLLGTDPVTRARIAEWNWRTEFEGLAAVAEALRNSSPRMKDRALTGEHNVAQIPELAERGLTRLVWFYDTLNEQLKTHEYVAGDSYSAADITATVTVDFGEWVKVTPSSQHKALLAWHERMKTRPNYGA